MIPEKLYSLRPFVVSKSIFRRISEYLLPHFRLNSILQSVAFPSRLKFPSFQAEEHRSFLSHLLWRWFKWIRQQQTYSFPFVVSIDSTNQTCSFRRLSLEKNEDKPISFGKSLHIFIPHEQIHWSDVFKSYYCAIIFHGCIHAGVCSAIIKSQQEKTTLIIHLSDSATEKDPQLL